MSTNKPRIIRIYLEPLSVNRILYEISFLQIRVIGHYRYKQQFIKINNFILFNYKSYLKLT